MMESLDYIKQKADEGSTQTTIIQGCINALEVYKERGQLKEKEYDFLKARLENRLAELKEKERQG